MAIQITLNIVGLIVMHVLCEGTVCVIVFQVPCFWYKSINYYFQRTYKVCSSVGTGQVMPLHVIESRVGWRTSRSVKMPAVVTFSARWSTVHNNMAPSTAGWNSCCDVTVLCRYGCSVLAIYCTWCTVKENTKYWLV